METKELTQTIIKNTATDMMIYRRSLATGEDLNNITQTGIYFSDLKTVVNAPENSRSFFLRVSRGINASYFVQEVMTGQGVMYVRHFWWQSWYPWQKVALESVT